MDINKHMVVGAVKQDKVEQPKDNAVLDQQDFLKILAATISNPPFPGGEGGGGAGGEMDFMTQMMQMNLLDQVTELTSTIESTMVMTHQQQALSLVGKHVTIAGEDKEIIKGIVEKVKFTPDGTATIQVDGKDYNLQSVTSVSEAGSVEEDAAVSKEPEGDTKIDTDTNVGGDDGN